MEKTGEIEKCFSQALEFEEQGKTEEAIKVYTRLIELEPERYVNYYNRGVLYGYLGELDKAIADYDKVLELSPNHIAARGNRSIAYSDKGEWDKAIVDSEKCVEIDPACFASINLPNLYHKRSGAHLQKSNVDGCGKRYKGLSLSALSGLTLVLNGLWDQFSSEEQEQLSQDGSTWPPELQKKVSNLLSGL